MHKGGKYLYKESIKPLKKEIGKITRKWKDMPSSCISRMTTEKQSPFYQMLFTTSA